MIIPRKCPIIPRKLKREDTGSYDNTAEVSEKITTNSHIMDHKDRIRTRNDVTCFHLMDNKDCCSSTTTYSHKMDYKNHKFTLIQDSMAIFSWTAYHEFFIPMLPMEEAFSPYTCNPYGVFWCLTNYRPQERNIKQHQRKKRKRRKIGRGVYVTPDILVQT